jgi:hypothetical protein
MGVFKRAVGKSNLYNSCDNDKSILGERNRAGWNTKV